MKKAKVRKSPSILLSRLQKRFPKVRKVVDANESIAIHVKDSDCRGALSGSFDECALARATRREFKADACMIGLAFSYVIRGDTATRYRTPQSVGREVVSFDRHHDFDSGEYHLASASESQQIGAAQQKRTHKRALGPHAKRRAKMHNSARVRRVKGE